MIFRHRNIEYGSSNIYKLRSFQDSHKRVWWELFAVTEILYSCRAAMKLVWIQNRLKKIKNDGYLEGDCRIAPNPKLHNTYLDLMNSYEWHTITLIRQAFWCIRLDFFRIFLSYKLRNIVFLYFGFGMVTCRNIVVARSLLYVFRLLISL